MRNYIFVLAIIINVITAEAQSISGRVVDKQYNPIANANVLLLSPVDSSFIRGVVSDAEGKFIVQAEEKECILKISSIGFVPRICSVSSNSIGDILLEPYNQTLKEVVVKASIPTMKMIAGGINVDVQHSLLSQAGTALEVLSEMPRVNVSSSGGISVFGKGTPLVYINNKKVRNNIELQQLESKDIKSVEIITAPGARYSAQVGSVIRINTIKRIGDYLSMFAVTRGGYSKDTYGVAGVSATYRKKGLELNIYPYYSNSIIAENNDFTTSSRFNDYTLKTMQHGEFSSRTQTFSPSAKISYDFNSHHSIGASVYLRNTLKYNGFMPSSYKTLRNGSAQGEVSQSSTHNYDADRQSVNAYYIGKIGKWSIQADGTYVNTKVDQGQHVTEVGTWYDDRVVNTLSMQNSHLWAWKAVGERKLWKGQLSLGLEQSYSHVKANSSNMEGYIDDSENKIRENNYACFATYGFGLGEWTLGTGIRYEHVNSDYYSFGILDPDVSRNYTDLYPNVYAMWNKNNWGLQLSYSKKTRRPSYSQLRSYRQYDNRFMYESGSPDLQPAINHDVELMVIWNWVNASFDYTYVRDAMIWKYDIYNQQETSYSHWLNIDKRQDISISVVMQPKFGAYQPQLMLAYGQQFLDAHKYGFVSSLQKPDFVASLTNKYVINKKFWLSLQGALDTGHDSGSQEHKAFGIVNFRAYKSFLKGTLAFNLYVNDIFKSQREQWKIRTYSVEASKDCYNYTRSVELKVTYSFKYKKSKYKGQGAGKAEQDRL